MNEIDRISQKYNNIFQLLLEYEELLRKNCNNVSYSKEFVEYSEVYNYLKTKALRTFLSIRMLLELCRIEDTFALLRVLLENICNLVFLIENPEKVNSYKTSEMKVYNTVVQTISKQTKFMKDVSPIFVLVDSSIKTNFKEVAQISKKIRKKREKDQWSTLTFEQKITDIGLPKLYIQYLISSGYIHSNWFEKNALKSLDESIETVTGSVVELYGILIRTLNKAVTDDLDPVIDETLKYQLSIERELKEISFKKHT